MKRPSVFLLVLLAACRPAPPEPAVRPGLPAVQPSVRVGLAVDTSEALVSGSGSWELLAGGRPELAAGAGETWALSADGAGQIRAARGGELRGPWPAPVVLRPATGTTLALGAKPYRGELLVRSSGPGRISVINILAMEEYLLGVVPAEIPPWEVEAVKAQAVAARTYAVGHMGRRERLGFDFYATVSDQVYGGLGAEDTLVTRAVRETRGEILTHNGQPILAFYHSTCGGRTAAIHEVWRRSPLPYLTSVSDRIPGSDQHYCEISNRFRWREEWSGEELATTLTRTLSDHLRTVVAPVSRIERVELTGGRTTSGRAQTLAVEADGRVVEVFGDSIRWILRPEPNRILNSVLISLNPEYAQGGLSRLTVEGGGWGHGIGMCQMGAIGRARAGQSYETILQAYYTGTQLTRLY